MNSKIPFFMPPLDLAAGAVDMTHGGGGLASAQLIKEVFSRYFDNPILATQNDFACVDLPGQRLVMSTDSYVISPLFFPGGNIGSLAVNGTVNDIAMSGASPLYLSVGFILEEGFALGDLARIAQTMATAAQVAGVKIITGDTKVVERGKGDGVYINTCGVGVLPQGLNITGANAQVGDLIIVSGTMGDHGVAIMANRENLEFETVIQSDSAPLNQLIAQMLQASPSGVHCLRDPTRGGLATSLNELAQQSNVEILLDESCIPVAQEVTGACELLGLDPLYIANEGKLVCICAAEAAETLLESMRGHEVGKQAAIIGKVICDNPGTVHMKTNLGGCRRVDWLTGEPLPRIC